VQRVVKRRGDQALQIAIASDRRRSSALNMGQRRSTDAARLSGLQNIERRKAGGAHMQPQLSTIDATSARNSRATPTLGVRADFRSVRRSFVRMA
jgi:hypothetical protein